jgi:hypothetical protein
MRKKSQWIKLSNHPEKSHVVQGFQFLSNVPVHVDVFEFVVDVIYVGVYNRC